MRIDENLSIGSQYENFVNERVLEMRILNVRGTKKRRKPLKNPNLKTWHEICFIYLCVGEMRKARRKKWNLN